MKLALHWRVLLGMLAGLAVGLLLNRFWDAETWASLGVKDAKAFLADARVVLPEGVASLADLPDDQRAAAAPNEHAGTAAWAAKVVVTINRFVGEFFLRALRFVAVPIVLLSLIVGAAGLGDLRRVGRIGVRTLAIYVATTAVAVTVGLVLANVVRPGSFVPAETQAALAADRAAEAAGRIGQAGPLPGPLGQMYAQLIDLVPTNPFASLAAGNMLQVIVLALAVGVGLTLIPAEKSAPVVRLCEALTDVIVKLVHAIMAVAPFAVFALLAPVVAAMGPGAIVSLGAYVGVVLAGLLVVVLVEYPLMLSFLARVSPVRFYKAIAPAQLLAFSTSSSSATLPVTMRCVRERLGVSEPITSFVCPLGATVNMDGTALYQGVATVFIAQMAGIPLGFADQVAVVLTATLASIGTPGIPGAGVVMLVVVLQSVGVPPAGIAVILGVDRLLDMCRTVVNVTGDAMTSAIVARAEGETIRPTA